MVMVKVFLKTHCYATATVFMQKKKKKPKTFIYLFILNYASYRI